MLAFQKAWIQCCGSGSVGSVCFWSSWIRILLPSNKNSKKNLDSYCFVISFWLLSSKNAVNVPSKTNKQNNWSKKISFLLASWRFMTKIEGSGSRSGSLVRGMDPQIRIRIHTKMSWICNTAWIPVSYILFSSATYIRYLMMGTVPRVTHSENRHSVTVSAWENPYFSQNHHRIRFFDIGTPRKRFRYRHHIKHRKLCKILIFIELERQYSIRSRQFFMKASLIDNFFVLLNTYRPMRI